MPLYPPQISPRLAWYRTVVFVVRAVSVCCMDRHIKLYTEVVWEYEQYCIWDVVPWSLVQASPTFQFTYFPHIELYSEDGASGLPRNVSRVLQTTRRPIGKQITPDSLIIRTVKTMMKKKTLGLSDLICQCYSFAISLPILTLISCRLITRSYFIIEFSCNICFARPH